MAAPCKDCPNRHPECHGQCEAYQAYRAQRDAALAERQRESMVTDYIVKNEQRIQRRKHATRRK